MIKLGDYKEEEAKKLTTDLKKAQIKYDVRIHPVIDHFKVDCLEGRFSELKVILKDTEKIEHTIMILKSILSQRPSPDAFKELFLKEYNPLRESERDQMAQILNKVSGNFQSLDEDDKKKVSQIFLKSADDEQSYYEAMSVLHRNNIEVGAEIGDLLDDPIIRTTRDLAELGLEKDHPLVRQTIIISAKKVAEVFIDEFSSISALNGVFDNSFFERFPAEYCKISALGSLLKELAERPSAGKMSMNEFAQICAKEFDNNGHLLIADFLDYASDLARILEKHGLIKIKGESIKWRVL
ncbi:MAG: hypothetical protein A4E49_01148 [Methanosaeta sp. PtaU1.Bin112]|nr:MAG: hypothetical protein A4E49_01148 [Methanosaeta sp. PtaU1.Bin112]